MKRLLILLPLIVTGMAMAQTSRNFRTATFGNLGTPTENNTRWCPDCQPTVPCTGGGTGAYAYANGSAWNCTEHTTGGGGSGSVTNVSVNNSVSGVTASVSNPTTTPVINLSGVPNIAASNITSGTIATARLGSGTANNTTFLRGDQTWASGIGTVTSVALGVPAEFTVSGSPVTGAGTLSFTKANQSANLVFAGPTTGSAAAPGFRLLVAADLPSITESKFSFSDITTANATVSAHGLLPKLSGSGTDCLRGDGTWIGCAGAGGGDVSSNTAVSTDGELPLFSGIGGKTLKRSNSFSGFALLTSGVLSAVGSTGSGNVVRDTSPVITTPTIGSFANATHNHTNAAGGGSLALNAFSSSTGSGAVVGQTSPALVTPSIGVATATSVNKVVITAPATSATLTIANGKTLTANNSLALSGTDSTTMTFPSTSGTVLTADSTATLTNKTHTLPILGGNSGLPSTCTVGQRVRDTSVSPNAFYNCIATDTWGQELVSGTVGAVTAANGGSGLVSGDAAGTITISGATSGTKTFSTTLSAAPKCIVVPTSDLGGVRFWITRSTTTLTVNTSASVSASFDYHCTLIP